MRFRDFYNQFTLVSEKFDTMDLVLQNPKYSDNFRYEVLGAFEQAGGEILGSGKFGQVLSFPSWRYVLKTFNDDRCYVKFVRLAMQNQSNPAFPKFFDKPRKIRPFYKRYKNEEFLYIVRMEKLYPIKMVKHEFEKIAGMLTISPLYHSILYRPTDLERYSWYHSLSDNHRKDYVYRAQSFYEENAKYRNLIDAYIKIHDYTLLDKSDGCQIDMHHNNIMQRADGELVLIDQLWYDDSPTPYAQHDHARNMEMDYYGAQRDAEEEDPDPFLRGGERNKRIKKKKQKKLESEPVLVSKQDDSDIPF